MEHVPFKLNKYSYLAEVPVEFTPAEIEASLKGAGVSAGIIDFDDQLPLRDYLTGERALEPYLKFGDIHEMVAAIEAKLADGRKASTFLTPRSAAGPNLRYLLTGHHNHGPTPLRATLRVRDLPEVSLRKAVFMEFRDEAVSLFREQIQNKNRPQMMRIYSPEILTADLGDRNTRQLVVFEYSGETFDTEFRFNRTLKALEAYSYEDLGEHEELARFRDSNKTLPIFGELVKEQHPEVIIHISVVWSKLIPMLLELERITGGIYPVRTTVSGAWHEAALLSVRLLSFEGERDRSLIANEVNDLLSLFTKFKAGILEITPTRGRIDKKWDSIFKDPLTERLY